jgi:hypothetical protein
MRRDEVQGKGVGSRRSRRSRKKREERGEDGGHERTTSTKSGKPVEHELYPAHNELSPAEHEW